MEIYKIGKSSHFCLKNCLNDYQNSWQLSFYCSNNQLIE